MGKKKRERKWPVEPLPLEAPVVDNHTHLPVHEGEIPRANGEKLPLDVQLLRASAANVKRVITSGCEVPALQPTLDIAHAYPDVFAALAIHPNEAAIHAGCTDPSPDGLTPRAREWHVPLVEALEEVSSRLSDPRVVAVGETGLDYFRTAEGRGREAQKESFRAHLEMARDHDLALQIHDRDAHADCVQVLKESASKDQRIVFHCFSGDAELARICAENGWFASFAGPITYPANEDLRAALLEMPRELVLVETDAPYLTPVPERGNPNASYVMPHTVRAIAELWELPEADTCRLLTRNTVGVYGLSGPDASLLDI